MWRLNPLRQTTCQLQCVIILKKPTVFLDYKFIHVFVHDTQTRGWSSELNENHFSKCETVPSVSLSKRFICFSFVNLIIYSTYNDRVTDGFMCWGLNKEKWILFLMVIGFTEPAHTHTHTLKLNLAAWKGQDRWRGRGCEVGVWWFVYRNSNITSCQPCWRRGTTWVCVCVCDNCSSAVRFTSAAVPFSRCLPYLWLTLFSPSDRLSSLCSIH